ncbi:SAP domain-containing ribonucleoprotein-like isoform X2 [Branchiostoma lanceolatum]|uniref:SAP domain-containing ribonucleoprotein-like isoform X2 n=1 Tax=Branchiostoma lanceolatum TaxID=7740 RepID=UPI0034543F98
MYRKDTPHHNFSKMETMKKLKVADLKNELRARGLTVTGNKQELLDRLQQHMETAGGVHGAPTRPPAPRGTLPPGMSLEDPKAPLLPEAELLSKDTSLLSGEGDEADDSILAGEEEEEEDDDEEEEEQTTAQDNQENTETTNTAKPTVVTSVSSESDDTKVPVKPPMSEAERLELRAKKFGGHSSEDAKKAARAARFGTSVSGPTNTAAPAKGATTLSPLGDNSAISTEETGPEMEKLKKRAERFGMNVSTAVQSEEEKEKLLKRKQRFGVAAAGAAGTQVSSDEVEAKKKKRAERFGLTV